MKITDYLTEEVIEDIFNSIEEAGGNEVFFTGQIDESGLVVSVKVGSRGSEHEVPVNFSDARNSCVLIHNHPSGYLTPSQADLNVAEQAAQNAQGFYIVNNNVNDIYVVVEPIKPKSIVQIDPQIAAALISNGGALSKQSNGVFRILDNLITPFLISHYQNFIKTIKKF